MIKNLAMEKMPVNFIWRIQIFSHIFFTYYESSIQYTQKKESEMFLYAQGWKSLKNAVKWQEDLEKRSKRILGSRLAIFGWF